MDLLILIVILALIGFLVHIITVNIPMHPMFRLAIHVVVIVALIIFLLRRFSVLPNVL